MRRRRPQRPGEETAFVDLAFSMLGPIAALMIVFAAAAAAKITPEPVAVCHAMDDQWAARTAANLRRELDRLGAEAARTRSLLESSCENGVATTNAPPPSSIEDAIGLKGVCAQDAAKVLAAAHTSLNDIAGLLAQRQQLIGEAAVCRPSHEETTARVENLEFEVCAADSDEDDDFFLARAREIQDELSKHNYNRIDILGHADPSPINGYCAVTFHLADGGTQDMNARDNEMLSMARAYSYRNRLLQILQNNPDFADIANRLHKRTLRIYAIAVADAEPVVNDYAKSRRIETRFANDRGLDKK